MSGYVSEYKNLGDDFFMQNIFNIPIYQRLYVWERMQVVTLIDDLLRAFVHDSHHEYFLGGILVVRNEDKLDLIDGQQRFTTLMILRELLGEKKLRLDFAIRSDVWAHFHVENGTATNADIRRMQEAKRVLKASLQNAAIDMSTFDNYLKEQVKLVVTTVPQRSDLNKLFELINGRGEQLLQHEILKAKILSRVENDKYTYGKIWDICANMDEFLEINSKKSFAVSWANHNFCESFEELFKRTKKAEKTPMSEQPQESQKFVPTLSNILAHEREREVQERAIMSDADDMSDTQYLSIISFEMFLLYALVGFAKESYFEKMDTKIEFKDKNLIQIFEKVLLFSAEDIESTCANFIKYLFEMRVKFDKFIIKNHKDRDDNSNESNHKISQVVRYESGKNISRQIVDATFDEKRSVELLQSMLYHAHTRNTQEWIIPFLNYVDEANSLELLKKIDNLLYSQINPEDTILKRAIAFDASDAKVNSSQIIEYLSKEPEDDNYHHISHYWYYKMDWILWDLSAPKDATFKFTARNSLEHIGPQNPQDENKEEDKVHDRALRHSFGNLFLVSVSQNSSVSNQGFHTKKAMFLKDKKINNLKLRLLENDENWGDDGVRNHLEKCITKVQEYFGDSS